MLSQLKDRQFFELYQADRFEDQLAFYKRAQEEFTKAQREAVIGSIILIFLSGVAGAIAASVDIHWLKLLLFLFAAIFPIFSTALAAYSTLFGFEHQAKLYQDTIKSLNRAGVLAPSPEHNLTESEFAHQLSDYVHEVEKIFLTEQGQWGQLAEQFKAAET
jgi:hypothetical protein